MSVFQCLHPLSQHLSSPVKSRACMKMMQTDIVDEMLTLFSCLHFINDCIHVFVILDNLLLNAFHYSDTPV